MMIGITWLSRDGAEVKFYVDGKLETTSQITDNDKSSPGEAVVIGARLLDSGQVSRYIQASIDEVAIYLGALTEAEVLRDMQNGVLSVSTEGKLVTTWANIKSK